MRLRRKKNLTGVEPTEVVVDELATQGMQNPEEYPPLPPPGDASYASKGLREDVNWPGMFGQLGDSHDGGPHWANGGGRAYQSENRFDPLPHTQEWMADDPVEANGMFPSLWGADERSVNDEVSADAAATTLQDLDPPVNHLRRVEDIERGLDEAAVYKPGPYDESDGRGQLKVVPQDPIETGKEVTPSNIVYADYERLLRSYRRATMLIRTADIRLLEQRTFIMDHLGVTEEDFRAARIRRKVRDSLTLIQEDPAS